MRKSDYFVDRLEPYSVDGEGRIFPVSECKESLISVMVGSLNDTHHNAIARLMLSQATTPLLDALRQCANQPHAAFYTPGHKRGVGIAQPLAELLGSAVFQADLTELAELDSLFAPEGVIQEAQELAAAAFGAEQTWFLVNGSTAGVMAAILATCGTGDKIILPRNVHSSAIAGLILSGAIPIFVHPEYDPIRHIAHSITPSAVQAALEKHPDAKAVMLVYPTYFGVCGDVGAIAHLTHQYNIPLLVDEAHGPHFAFHPDLPASALSAGADLTVQSIHKVLAAMTQASMLHVQGNRIDRDRVSKALQLVQSTSPSYILLASLDAARQQMALHGKSLMARTLQLADTARNQIRLIPGLSILESPILPTSPPSRLSEKTGDEPIFSPLDEPQFSRNPTPIPSPCTGRGAGGGVGFFNRQFTRPNITSGFVNLDRTRLTVTVSGLGITGFAADEILSQKLGVTAEFPSLEHLTFIISLGNRSADIERLVQALTTLAKDYRCTPSDIALPFPLSPVPPLLLSPREAFFAATETLPRLQTRDRICAELVCPYPPGIPILMPGEVITTAALDYLKTIQAMGGVISGCADTTVETLKVVKQ